MNIIDSIKNLNNPKFGSLGEFIFEEQHESKNIQRKHSECTDFILNGRNIDVKSTRIFDQLFKKIKIYNGKRHDDISYAYLQFYKDIVLCSIENEVLFTLDYLRVEGCYKRWGAKRKSKVITTTAKISSQYKESLEKIKKEIKLFYEKSGINCRIIYRTNQSDFGKESPGNLLPKHLKNKGTTVFINFKNHVISESNIEGIIAFPDIESKNFPLLKKPKLHLQKVDIEKLDDKYKYRSLNKLFESRDKQGNKV